MDCPNQVIDLLIGREFMVDDLGRRCVIIKYKNSNGDLLRTSPQPMGILVEHKHPVQGEFSF